MLSVVHYYSNSQKPIDLRFAYMLLVIRSRMWAHPQMMTSIFPRRLQTRRMPLASLSPS